MGELLVQPARVDAEEVVAGRGLHREQREALEDAHVVPVVLDGEPLHAALREGARAQVYEVAALQQPLDAGLDDLVDHLVDESLRGSVGAHGLPPAGGLFARIVPTLPRGVNTPRVGNVVPSVLIT